MVLAFITKDWQIYFHFPVRPTEVRDPRTQCLNLSFIGGERNYLKIQFSRVEMNKHSKSLSPVKRAGIFTYGKLLDEVELKKQQPPIVDMLLIYSIALRDLEDRCPSGFGPPRILSIGQYPLAD